MEQGLVNKENLVAIGNSIRAKNGTQDTYTPAEMAAAIDAIESGGGDGPSAEDLTLTGSCDNRFGGGAWDWVINKYGNKITTNNISGITNMFSNTNIQEIPFDINCAWNPFGPMPANAVFAGSSTHNIPKFSNCPIGDTSSMFENCLNVRYFPEGFETGFDFSKMDDASPSPFPKQHNNMLKGCCSLRQLPYEFMKHGCPFSITPYYAFANNYCLDEIVDLPNPYYNASWNQNCFGNPFNPNDFIGNCHHLKDLTFAANMTNEQLNAPNWTNQIIEVTKSVGYVDNFMMSLAQYGLPAEKEILDDATYQQFKNDPEAWTRQQAYSRYNLESAIRTIESLPDTSGYIASNGGINTIKFAGANGSSTDGGAISNLDQTYIDMAAAKGWTVEIV